MTASDILGVLRDNWWFFAVPAVFVCILLIVVRHEYGKMGTSVILVYTLLQAVAILLDNMGGGWPLRIYGWAADIVVVAAAWVWWRRRQKEKLRSQVPAQDRSASAP